MRGEHLQGSPRIRRFRELASTLAIASLGLATACGDELAGPHVPTQTLYDKYGGNATVVVVVDAFIARVAGDARINAFFAEAAADSVRLTRLKARLVEQVAGWMGGPEVYTGRDMVSAHRFMGVGDREFDALIEDLVLTLRAAGVEEADIAALAPRLLALRGDIVVRANLPR